ncbi:MAG: hypothetical protein WDZ51_17285 [Pirellulaceae bacterium]
MKCTIQRSLAALLSFALILPLSVHAAQDDDQTKDKPESETQVEQKDDQESPIFPAAESDRDDENKDKEKEQPPRIQTDRRNFDDPSAIQGDKQHQGNKTAKAFELKHRSPEEMKQLIKMCDEGLKPHEVGAASQQPGVRQQEGVRPGQQRPGAQPGQRPGVQPGQQPGQQQPGQQADSRQQTNRATYDGAMKHDKKKIDVAVSEDSDILFVRASEEHMKQVQKLVDCFDVEDNKLKKAELVKVTIIPVSLEKAQQAESTLQREQLRNHQVFKMGQVALVVIGDDEQNGENRKKAEEAVAEFEKDKDADQENNQRDPLNPQAQPGQTPGSQPGQNPGSQPGQTPEPQSAD